MSTKSLVAENEAVTLAGVSARTLLRFSESGYLTVETDATGGRWFSRSQLEEIFGATTVPSNDGIGLAEESSTDVSGAATEENSKDASSCEDHPDAMSTPERSPESDTNIQVDDNRQETARGTSSSAYLEIEIQRLQNLLSIQERILDAKDDEIADLKGQRGWLRERIEKLEEKSDRDQILLLSETQTIRKLISYQESRKSPVKQLLEWIGLSRSTEVSTLTTSSDFPQGSATGNSSRTIEVRTAANSQ